jgi:carbonic anhydrase
LRDRYQLDQVHAHWGETDAEGSEHLLDGQQFCGEMHFVHWNQTKYEDVNQALNHDDGLSVIGIFYKVCEYKLQSKI